MNCADKTLLLVEDETIIALMETAQLKSAGYHVLHVTSGEEAIELVRSRTVGIDLVLMDINLGRGLDGTDAAREIIRIRDIPVVFLSSHTEKEIVEKTETITSYGYVVKNSGDVVLQASIRMAFKLFEAKRSIAAQNARLASANQELQTMNEELRQSQAALLSQRERVEWWHDLMQYVVRYDPGAIAILDSGLHFMYVSERFLHDYRVDDRDIIGRHHYEVFPDIPRKWRDVHHRALQGETLQSDDDSFVRLDGTVDFTRWQCRPWYTAAGEIGGIILYTEVINEQKRIERQLRQSERRFRTIVDSMHDVVFTLDLEGRYTGVYGKWVAELGLTPDHFVGRIFPEILGAEAAVIHEDALRRASAGEFIVYDWSAATENGTRFFQTSLSPMMTEERTVTAVVGVGRDITTLLQMDEAMRKADALRAAAVAASPHPLFSIDCDGIVLTWNPAAERVFGWSREAVIGKILPLVPEEDTEQFAALRRRVVQGEILSGVELGRTTRSGELLDIRLSAAPIRNRNGQVIGIMAYMEDVTDRKRVERDVESKSALLHGILESTPFSVFSLDRDYRYTSFNEAHARVMRELYGANIEIGHSLYEYQTVEEDCARSKHNLDRALCGEQFTDEAHSGSVELARIYVEVTHTPVRDVQGDVIGVAVFSRDVTERKAAEEHIRALLREKELLLKESHHRIKNNMATMHSLLSLQSNRCSESYCRNILGDAAGRLQSMSLLYDKLYRSDGHRALNVREYLTELIKQIVAVLDALRPVRTNFEVQDITLSAELLSPVGIIINELITNSVRHAFGDAEAPLIAVSLARQADLIILQYADNGSGLPAAVSLENSSGFGLQLVGALARQIGAVSRIERGDGTRFIFEFAAD